MLITDPGTILMAENAHAPLVLINAVGLTPRLLPWAPRLRALSESGGMRPLRDVLPSVTCSAQASMLTGQPPSAHGIVGNGWLFRDTGEVRFWQQSNRLIEREPLYATARKRASERGRKFRAAKLFWWFNQGAEVDLSVTPKPYYGADGNKAFGIWGTPENLPSRLEKVLGPFPFPTFWGPGASLPCSRWIGECAREVLRSERPDLTLVYVPHLDYDPQRFGPSKADMPRLVRELDDACVPLLDQALTQGAEVWVVSEYGHVDVSRVVEPNRLLRRAGLLSVRNGPFGEILETFESRAFAVCDHQLAHIYVKRSDDLPRVVETLSADPAIDRLFVGEERAEIGLDHPRSGEVVALSKPDAWFAYPYWLDDRQAPDFARSVDIHRKPGFDPCELFFDPALPWPRGRAIRRLIQKKLGFRTLFDVVPLNPGLIGGSHGLLAASPADGPLLIGAGTPETGAPPAPLTSVRDRVLDALGLGEG